MRFSISKKTPGGFGLIQEQAVRFRWSVGWVWLCLLAGLPGFAQMSFARRSFI
jgi:hypothetical protein